MLEKLTRVLDVTIDDLLFVEGLQESEKDIKERILRLLETTDAKKLRKWYRMLLITIEE
jgi:hypothetical protein